MINQSLQHRIKTQRRITKILNEHWNRHITIEADNTTTHRLGSPAYLCTHGDDVTVEENPRAATRIHGKLRVANNAVHYQSLEPRGTPATYNAPNPAYGRQQPFHVPLGRETTLLKPSHLVQAAPDPDGLTELTLNHHENPVQATMTYRTDVDDHLAYLLGQTPLPDNPRVRLQ